MIEILRAVGTFLIALIVGVAVEKVLALMWGVNTEHATAIGMAVLVGVGFYLCNLGRKTPPQR